MCKNGVVSLAAGATKLCQESKKEKKKVELTSVTNLQHLTGATKTSVTVVQQEPQSCAIFSGSFSFTIFQLEYKYI